MDDIEDIEFEDINKEVERTGIYLEYYNKFGKDPEIIGMFWNDIYELELNLKKAIKKNIEYNEYELLSAELKDAFDNGDLVF